MSCVFRTNEDVTSWRGLSHLWQAERHPDLLLVLKANTSLKAAKPVFPQAST
jgi:hypothetical protein